MESGEGSGDGWDQGEWREGNTQLYLDNNKIKLKRIDGMTNVTYVHSKTAVY